MNSDNTYNVLNTLYNGMVGRKHFAPLYIAEGGSRAWGYANEESDFDVKFVYRQQEVTYQTIFEVPENFVYKYPPLYDFNGWDVTKFLKLLYKGNAQTYELMGSEIVYFDSPEGRELRDFTIQKLKDNLVGVAYHYLGLTHSTFKERVVTIKEPTTKKYFYVARPLLAVEMMVNEQTLPELNFVKLLERTQAYANVPKDVFETFHDLLTMKRNGELTTAMTQRLSNVDKWVVERLDYYFKRVKLEDMLPKTVQDKEEYDEMFRKLVFCS